MPRIKDINDRDGNLYRRQFMCPDSDARYVADKRYRNGKCHNTLTIFGDADDVIIIMVALRGREDLQHKDYATNGYRPLALNAFVPLPDLIKVSRPSQKHNWAKDKWGVKYGAWDVGLESVDGSLIYTFTTFGGPPQVWVRTLSERFPETVIQLEYEENYYPFARGKFLYQDGEYLRSLVSIIGSEQGRKLGPRKVMVDRGAMV